MKYRCFVVVLAVLISSSLPAFATTEVNIGEVKNRAGHYRASDDRSDFHNATKELGRKVVEKGYDAISTSGPSSESHSSFSNGVKDTVAKVAENAKKAGRKAKSAGNAIASRIGAGIVGTLGLFGFLRKDG